MEESLVIARSFERNVFVLGAFFCFWLAYKFQAGKGDGTASVVWDKFKVELKKIGPSIFFTLLGVVIIITSLRSPLEITKKDSGESSYRYFSRAQRDAVIVKMSSLDYDIRAIAAYEGTL